MSIRPTLEISSRVGGGAVIVGKVEFDQFDKAMEFNALLVDFLRREMKPTEPEIFVEGAISNAYEAGYRPDGFGG